MLTQKAKYAIKALTYLAQQQKQVRTSDIATGGNIPKKFLEAILLELKSHGLVASRQGMQGGYYLLRNASAITLADVYRMFEGPVALVPCVSEKAYQPCRDCVSEANCTIRKAMFEVRAHTLRALEDITIQKMAMEDDVVPQPVLATN